MNIINEFKTFVQRGNVIDMAVGIIMGAAFTKIVGSLVDNVLMPPIGFLMAGINFTDLVIPLGYGDSIVNIRLGMFIQAVIDFFIVAFCVFLLVKAVNVLKNPLFKSEEPKPVEIPPDIKLLTEIRDLLKAQQ
jgi:large conductance mechanosensitive channel